MHSSGHAMFVRLMYQRVLPRRMDDRTRPQLCCPTATVLSSCASGPSIRPTSPIAFGQNSRGCVMSVVFLYSFFSWRRVFVGFSKQNLKSTPRHQTGVVRMRIHVPLLYIWLLDPQPRIPTRFTGTTIDTPLHMFSARVVPTRSRVAFRLINAGQCP